jgi:formate hydrogenlyase subunit 3/multisubunit Na+/H+ antiporter MnhD subunit
MGAFNFRVLTVDGEVLAVLLAIVIVVLTLLAAAYMGTLMQRESAGSGSVIAVPVSIMIAGGILVWIVWRLLAVPGRALPLGPVLGFGSATGIVLGAWYLLTLLQRVFFGPVKEPEHEGHGPVGDLGWREFFALAPIAILCLVIGVCPQPVLDAAQREVEVVAHIADRAREMRAREPLAPIEEAAAGQKDDKVTR